MIVRSRKNLRQKYGAGMARSGAVAKPWWEKSGKGAATGRIVLAAALLFSTGCVHAHSARFIIPARCVGVNIQSFTEPCVPRDDGKLVCNGVVITANCVTSPERAIRRSAVR
jgi:hypothetical protein